MSDSVRIESLPRARVVESRWRKRAHWTRYLIWLIPACAALGASFYFYDFYMLRGPVITIRFHDVEGIKPGDTPVQHLGVQIGQVTAVRLSDDSAQALVEIRLNRDAKAFAQEGAAYWTVRPEASGAGVTGLSTVFSGPYVDASPGRGPARAEFSGLENAPIPNHDGLSITLHTPRLDHLSEKSPVTYRGIQVGQVKDIRLAREADHVDARLLIARRYAALVRKNSRFWALSGFDVQGGILSGVSLKLESLRTLVSGGIAFATPEEKDMGPLAREGDDFTLENHRDDDWLKWAPKIRIAPESSGVEHPTPQTQKEIENASQ